MVNRPSVASDEQMAAEALRGDQEAFTHLYQQYFDQVYDLAARVLKDSAAASDVAQNVFMKFLGGTEVKPPQVSFRAWLYTMTRNAAIDELRRRQRLVPMAGPEMEDTAFIQVSTSVQGDPERMALDNDLAALVWEAAQSLNPNDYTLLDLNIRKGLEPDELADALGISRGNVYTRLSRLRDSLEEAVTTLILARRGRQDCSQLNELLLRFGSSESVDLTPRSRRAVSRHIAECPICEANRRRYISAADLFGGLVPVLPAAALRSEIWGSLLARAAANPTPPPQSPPPPSTPATVASEFVKSSAQVWSSLGAGVQTLVVGMVVVGAIGAAAAIAILAPPFLSSSFPTISQFQLVDPDVGPGGIARHRELQVQLQVDEESGDGLGDITWLLREGTVPQPTPQDLDWASSPPSTYVLSPGDGPKPVDLWLKGRKDEITHGAQFLVLLDTTFPQDPSRAFSSSHQIATPSTNNLVTVQWEAAQDPEPGSGIAGYSTVWDRFPTTLPDPVLDLDGSVTETISPPLEFGTWYFHLSTLDRAGNFTTTLHVGPFVIIDSSFAQAPSSGTDGQTDSTAGGTSGGEAGPPSSVEETAPGVDQPEPLQPLEELPADVPPAEGPVGPVPEIPSDNRPGEQVDDSGDISGGGGEQGSEADSEPDNNEDRGGDTGGDGGGSGDSDGSNSGAGSGDDGSSGGGGVQSDDDDDDGDGNFLPFQPDPTGPPPGEQVRLSVTVVVTGDTISRVEDVVIYTYVVTNDSSSDATPLILDDLTDTLLGNLNSPTIEAGCGTLLPGGSCSFELSRQVQPADPDPLVNAVTANYHAQGFGEALSDADSHSVDLFQPSVVMSVTGEATSIVGDSVTYTYIVTNTSSDDAPDLVLASITDDLLEDLTGNAADAGCGVLASGDLCSFEVTRQVLSEDPDPLVNTVEARYQPQGFSGNITDSGSHSVDVLGPAEDGIPSGVDCNPNIADHHVVDPLGAVPASFLGMAHKTLQSAVTAALDNQVISLYADIRENVVIGSSTTSGDKDLLIVGCGHTITADASTFPVVHVEVSAGADDGDTGAGSSDINIEGLDVQGGSTGFLVETSKSPAGTGTSLTAVRADSNGVGIKIIGSNNVVRGANSINSNTGFGVQITGDNNVIETSKLEENGDSAIHVTGDGNQIKGNDVGDTNRGNGGEGISVNGDSNVIEGNNVFASAGTGINLVGDKGSIKENSVGTNNGLRNNGDGVVVKGYYTLTDRNDILANRGLGISATYANSSTPEGNDGGTNNRWNEGAGIQVTGNGVAIEENEVFSNGGAGIEVTGDSAVIKENRVGANHQGNTGNGIQVTGNGATIEENEVFNSGGAGIVVDGDENVVKENRVGNENDQGNGGDGISVTGGNNMIEGNQVFGNAEDGIDVSGGSAKLPNIVKQNKVGDSGGKGNGGHGILVSGDGNGDGNPVEIEENTVKASGLAGIKVEGTGHGLRENESGGKGAEDNGGCDYDLAEGNLDQRENHSDGSAVDLSVSGCIDEAPGDENGSVD